MEENNTIIRVVCAIIRKKDKVLLAKRPNGKSQAGFWEFAGGKVNPQESETEALNREIKEELGISLVLKSRLSPLYHAYPEKTILLIPYEAEALSVPQCLEHEDIQWVDTHAVLQMPLAAADEVLWRKLQSEEQADCTLLVFAKSPRIGKVKTRIASELGDAPALEIYTTLLKHTFTTCMQTNYGIHLWTDDFWPPGFEELYDACSRVSIQSGKDLGEKMWNASIQSGRGAKVIIGADCPGLQGKQLEEAFHALVLSDLVFGPSLDGGYYLIAFRDGKKTWFEGVDWSTERVLDQSLERVKQSAASFYLLEQLADVDTARDWQDFKGSIL